MKAVVTTVAIRLSKLQSNRHHQHTITQTFLQAGCPSCRPTNTVRALKGGSLKPIVSLKSTLKLGFQSKLNAALVQNRIWGLDEALISN